MHYYPEKDFWKLFHIKTYKSYIDSLNFHRKKKDKKVISDQIFYTMVIYKAVN